MTAPSKNTSHIASLKERSILLTDHLQHRLAHLDALPLLTLLGLICGLLAALTVVLFRYTIELILHVGLQGNSEGFEALPRHLHFWLPFGGALIIGIALHWLPKHAHAVSVGHVLERLHNHQGRLPVINWLWQFGGGVLALISGQAMGREGPAVHLGAGASSLLGRWLRLPNNCLRTLIGCGVAAAISASFNTPMAGVIFSMEVILMEYTIAGFIPVMLASVIGAVVCRLTFGEEPAFSVGTVQLNTLFELPLIAIMGFVIAGFAAAFIRINLYCHNIKHWPAFVRMALAGLITGLLALYTPQILGIGYDTIDALMAGQIGLQLILAIAVCKLLATASSSGLGLPGGIIGPSLFIGATIGGAVGMSVAAVFPEHGANPSFYVLLGMSAMMASVINAPLAALITVFELTQNPHIVFPTMLIVVIAVLTTRQVFRSEGLFLAQLTANGYSINNGPLRQALNRVGVRSVMDTKFTRCNNQQSRAELDRKLAQHPKWLVVDELDQEKYLLAAADVSAYLENNPPAPTSETAPETDTPDTIKLLDIPGRQWLMKPIPSEASLYEAQQLLSQFKADALYVERQGSKYFSPVVGIVTAERINNYYTL